MLLKYSDDRYINICIKSHGRFSAFNTRILRHLVSHARQILPHEQIPALNLSVPPDTSDSKGCTNHITSGHLHHEGKSLQQGADITNAVTLSLKMKCFSLPYCTVEPNSYSVKAAIELRAHKKNPTT